VSVDAQHVGLGHSGKQVRGFVTVAVAVQLKGCQHAVSRQQGFAEHGFAHVLQPHSTTPNCTPTQLGSWLQLVCNARSNSMTVCCPGAAGGANCVLGTFLMRDLLGMPWLIWLIPAAGSLGGLMLIGMLLEVPRMRRVKEVSSVTLLRSR
jgi:hypothetical protein